MKNQNLNKNVFTEIYYLLYVIGLIIIFPLLIAFAILIKLFRILQNKQRNKSLKGQVAVVTGSARGLGRSLAIELAQRGCHVAIVDVQQDLAEETASYIAEKYQVKAKSYKVDVSDYEQLVELNKNVSKDLGDTTVLINNAAILTLSSLTNPSPKEVQMMVNVNFTAICFTHKIFLPKMKELNRGHIVNISSLSALLTSPFLSIYASTKAALRSLTSALRMELMSEFKNITATTVMPLFLNTNRMVGDLASMSGYTKLIPLLEGSEIAHYVIECMLNNEDEITIPNAFLYVYKLMELLPTAVREVIQFLIIFRGYNRVIAGERNNEFLMKFEF